MKLLGHPIHLMLVHFPTALFPSELLLYVAFYVTRDYNFAYASVFVLMIGVCIGWFAALFGALDVGTISSENHQVIKRALIHGIVNGTVLIVYTVMAYRIYMIYPDIANASLLLLSTKGFLVFVLMVGNFMGGNLVLKDKVGIDTQN